MLCCAVLRCTLRSLSICTVAVGFLPVDLTPSMAAMAVANSIYGIVATFFGSLRISACTRCACMALLLYCCSTAMTCFCWLLF